MDVAWHKPRKALSMLQLLYHITSEERFLRFKKCKSPEIYLSALAILRDAAFLAGTSSRSSYSVIFCNLFRLASTFFF